MSPAGLKQRRVWDEREAILWPAALFVAWIIAWLVNVSLRDRLQWNETAETIYWIAMKIAIWIVPVFVVLRKKSLPVAEYVGLRTPGLGLGIGMLAGIGLLAFSYAMDAVLGSASFNIPVLDAALFNGVIVAPIVEEFTLRGFYMESLERSGLGFMQANSRAAILFVAMHLPGWYFQGRLRAPESLIQPAVFLWLLALLLGWIKNKSGSLYAVIAVHVLNNIYSAARG